MQSTAQGSHSRLSRLITCLIQTCLLSNTDKTTFLFLNCIFLEKLEYIKFLATDQGEWFLSMLFLPHWKPRTGHIPDWKTNKTNRKQKFLWFKKILFLYAENVGVQNTPKSRSAYPPLPTQPKTTSASPLPLWSDSAGGTPRCQPRGPSETWESETPPLLQLTASCHCTPCTPVPTATPRQHHTTSQLACTYITTCFWILCSLAYSARTLFLSFLPLGTKSLCSFFFFCLGTDFSLPLESFSVDFFCWYQSES